MYCVLYHNTESRLQKALVRYLAEVPILVPRYLVLSSQRVPYQGT